MACLAALMLSSRSRAAEPETATLQFDVPTGSDCPDEESLRQKVASRIGYDPFRPSGLHRVTISVVRAGRKLVARAEVSESEGARVRARELVGTARDCEVLLEALATTVAIAIDPMAGMPPSRSIDAPRPAPPIESIAPEDRIRVDEPTRLEPTGEAPRVADHPPSTFFARAGGVVSTGVTPGVAIGAELAVGARRERLSLDVSARVEAMPQPVRTESGDRLEGAALSGALTACAHAGALLGCAFGRLGALQGRAPDAVDARLGTAVVGALGLRGGARLSLTPRTAVIGFLEGGIPLVRTSAIIGARTAWTAPVVFGGASAAIELLFP